MPYPTELIEQLDITAWACSATITAPLLCVILQRCSSSDIEDISYSSDDFSSEEESVIMLSYPDHQMPRSISAISLGADVQSICSQNQSEYIKIIEDNDMKKVLKEVRGCLIHPFFWRKIVGWVGDIFNVTTAGRTTT
jgi:hypothetical protein